VDVAGLADRDGTEFGAHQGQGAAFGQRDHAGLR
jgi:hypothetical protein